MSAIKNFLNEVQTAITSMLEEDHLTIEQIVVILEDEFHDEFFTGYIDESGVRMALEFLSEDEQIYLDNRTEKYILLS